MVGKARLRTHPSPTSRLCASSHPAFASTLYTNNMPPHPPLRTHTHTWFTHIHMCDFLARQLLLPQRHLARPLHRHQRNRCVRQAFAPPRPASLSSRAPPGPLPPFRQASPCNLPRRCTTRPPSTNGTFTTCAPWYAFGPPGNASRHAAHADIQTRQPPPPGLLPPLANPSPGPLPHPGGARA